MKITSNRALIIRGLFLSILSVVSITGLSTFVEAATCLTCHAPPGSTTDIRPAESTYRNITTGSFKGSHAKHIPLPTMLANDCAPCHGPGVASYTASHRNGFINVTSAVSVGYSKGTSFAQSGNPVLGTCSAALCHDNGKGVLVTTPVWGVSEPACTVCHAPVPGDSHPKHITDTQYKKALCADCHSGYVQGSTVAANHLNNTIEVNTGGYLSPKAKGSTFASCNTSYCHSSGQAANGGAGQPAYAAVTWGSSVVCGSCHATTAPNFASGSHSKHLASDTNCGNCHTDAAATSYNATTHVDGQINVSAGLAYPAAGTPGNGYGSCTTACHSATTAVGITPTWGTAGDCATCHASVPPTGTHAAHSYDNDSANGTIFFRRYSPNIFVCKDCHDGAVKNLNAGSSHLNNTIDVSNGYPAAVAKHASGSGYSSCATSYCHSSGQSVTNGNDATPVYAAIPPVWGGTRMYCGYCHTAYELSSGSHAKHNLANPNACFDCHTGAMSALYREPTHINGLIDVTSELKYELSPGVSASGTPGNGYGTCSTASCHDSGKGIPVITPVWGTAVPVCSACHETSPATESHAQHLANTGRSINVTPNAFSCGDCHAGVTQGASANATDHLDGNIDVYKATPGDLGYTANKAKGSAPGTCATSYCHSSGQGATANDPTPVYTSQPPTWGVPISSNCNLTCHATSAISTGSHSKHFAQSNDCNNCHNLATPASYKAASHINGVIDVGTGSYTAGGAPGNGYGTCSTASCHADPYSAGTVTTPRWGDSAASCSACHNGGGAFTGIGTAPATGTHNAHMTLAGSSCGQCHTGTVAGVNGGTAHINGTIDVTGGYPVTAKHTAGAYTGSCSTTLCHGSSSPVWGTTTPNDLCTKCHGTGTITAITVANRHLVAPSDSGASDVGKVSANIKIGAHQTHLQYFNGLSSQGSEDDRCNNCHGSLPTSGLHANGTSTPAFQGLATTSAGGTMLPSFTAGNCSNTYCHNPAGTGGTLTNSGSNTSPSWTDAAYIDNGGKTQTNCGKCHMVPGDAGFTKQSAHGSMATNNLPENNCVGCHGHNGDSTGSVGQSHMDGVFYVSTDCNSCHGYPPMTQAQLDARAGSDFIDGRVEVAGGGGHHSTHLLPLIVKTDGFAPCLPCHPSTAHMQGGATVVRANVQVNAVDDTGYRFDESRSKRYNMATLSCSNVSCHYKPTPAW
ncbi:MAG: CxxxxCH/CxxCH domain-containing protein [Desulfuromonadaceae bacterium]|nr:CxxxxCH/CxxCH domain-containing protein [Desulfuromonadaceae bacterium]